MKVRPPAINYFRVGLTWERILRLTPYVCGGRLREEVGYGGPCALRTGVSVMVPDPRGRLLASSQRKPPEESYLFTSGHTVTIYIYILHVLRVLKATQPTR